MKVLFVLGLVMSVGNASMAHAAKFVRCYALNQNTLTTGYTTSVTVQPSANGLSVEFIVASYLNVAAREGGNLVSSPANRFHYTGELQGTQGTKEGSLLISQEILTGLESGTPSYDSYASGIVLNATKYAPCVLLER